MITKLETEIIALADYASLSKENKLTIAGIFDRIFVNKLPSKWPKMFLVLVLKGNPESRHKLEVTIDSQTEKKNILRKGFEIRLGNNGKANLITELVDFPLKWTGKYRISVRKDTQEIGYFGFSVVKTGGIDAKRKKVTLPN